MILLDQSNMVLELVVVVIEGELCCKSVVFFRESSTEKGGVHAHTLTLKSVRDQESGVTLG